MSLNYFSSLLLIFVLFSNGLNNYAQAAAQRKQTVAATWGGAQYGSESPLAQQLKYLKETLPLILDGWRLTVVPDSLQIDSQNNHSNQPFIHYKHNAQGAVTFFPYIHRTVTFFVTNLTGQILSSKIYLLEQSDTASPKSIKGNSTLRTTSVVRSGKVVHFSLTASLKPSSFLLELDYKDFQFNFPQNTNQIPASSEQILQFTKDRIQFMANPHGLTLLPESLDIAYYYDHRQIYRFPDRQGHLVSFILKNNIGQNFSGTTHLWRSDYRNLEITYPRNSTLRSIPSLLTNDLSELWLARGYTNFDVNMELNLKSFRLKGLSLKTSNSTPLCEQQLIPRKK